MATSDAAFRRALEDCLTLIAVPDGFVRVLASDGGIHDVPAINFKFALRVDPRLTVLPANPLKMLTDLLWRDEHLPATSYPVHAPSDWQ